jgi:hypothetical protein
MVVTTGAVGTDVGKALIRVQAACAKIRDGTGRRRRGAGWRRPAGPAEESKDDRTVAANRADLPS